MGKGKLDKKVKEVVKKLKKFKGVVVAFSGGVDSSVVLALAKKALGDNVLAVTVDSPVTPPWELKEAVKIANLLGVKHLVVRVNELEEVPGFAGNPRDRCYLCKKFRFSLLKRLAAEKGFNAVLDGTNLSDLGEYRPGLRALKELGVISPLLEARLGKSESREVARFLGLPNYDKASNACLATRFPYGCKLTVEKLRRVAEAERFLREELGVKVVRVRDHGDLARIEVGREERKVFFNEDVMDLVARKLKDLGYRFVTLDLEGYRFGSFD